MLARLSSPDGLAIIGSTGNDKLLRRVMAYAPRSRRRLTGSKCPSNVEPTVRRGKNWGSLSPPTQAVRLWWKDILMAQQKTGVPADWIAAEILNESGGDPAAGNPTGAYGLMQLEPATAHGLPGYTPDARHNPLENLILGAELLDANYRQWHSWRLASAAYYGGSGRVQGTGVVPGMPWSQASGRLMVGEFPCRQFSHHDGLCQ